MSAVAQVYCCAIRGCLSLWMFIRLTRGDHFFYIASIYRSANNHFVDHLQLFFALTEFLFTQEDEHGGVAVGCAFPLKFTKADSACGAGFADRFPKLPAYGRF